MRIGVLVCLAVAACISPDLVPCGDNSCPQGTICLADVGRCVTQGELDACSGTADGTLCTVDSTIGICANGACTLARCGDGILEPGEGCDGAVPTGVGCDYFGYYRGSLACSDTCQLDTSTCSGRCGDGTIDVDQGEYCDGAIPVGASCLDFGYDVGRLVCGGSCGANLSSCHQLKWEAVAAVHDPINTIWGGGGRLGFITDDSTAAVLHDGVRDAAPGSGYTAIGGDSSEVWAISPTAIAMWTTAGWTTAAPPWPSTDTVSAVWLGDTLGVYVAFNETADLWHLAVGDQNWTPVTGTWAAGATFGQTTDVLCVNDGNDVATYDGTSWSSLGVGSVTWVGESLDRRLWAGGTGELFVGAPGSWTTVSLVNGNEFASAFAVGRRGVYVGERSGGGPGDNPQDFYAIGDDPLHLPWPHVGMLISDGTGAVYTATATGLYALARGAWADNIFSGFFSVRLGSDGTTTITAEAAGVIQEDISGNWVQVGSNQTCFATQVAGGFTYCGDNGKLVINNGSATTTVSPPSLAAWWVAPDGGSGALVGDHVFASGTDLTWTTTTPPIKFTELVGFSISDLYAIGTGDGDPGPRLWHYDGASWTGAIAPPTNGIATLIAGTKVVYALTGDGLATYDRTTGMLTTAALPFALAKLTGIDDELFALDQSHALWFYDGAWTPVSLSTTLTALDISSIYDTGGQLFVTAYITGSAQQLSSLVRTGAWTF